MSIYAGQTPRELYRSFYRHLRHLPDPHVWSILQPRFRHLLERSSRQRSVSLQREGDKDGHPFLVIGSNDEAESSARGALRAARARKDVEDELRKLQMAVSCYPHALRRLLAECYGRTGNVRWELINSVMMSSKPPLSTFNRPDLPRVLKPLAPPTPGQAYQSPRARTSIPDTAKRKALKDAWKREWTGVRVPLVVPGTGTPKTGWEGKGVIESLRIVAQLELAPMIRSGERSVRLPSFDHLPSKLQRIYPLRVKPSPVPQYKPPPPRSTRQNPKTWSNPRTFNGRKLRRAYKRLWTSLPWVTQVNVEQDEWRTCTFEVMVDPSSGLSRSTRGNKKNTESVSVSGSKGDEFGRPMS